MTFTVALMIAVSYWGARDVQIPCHPTLVNASSAQMAAWDAGDGIEAFMRTDSSKCIIYQGAFAEDQARIWFQPYCKGIVHEVGHVAGLPHSYGGVMAITGRTHTPWGCQHPQEWLERHGYRKPLRHTQSRHHKVRRNIQRASAVL